MNSTPLEPCPCENEDLCPEGAPGPVADDETLLRFVPLEQQLTRDDSGRLALLTTAFPKDELACKDPSKKSASLLRSCSNPDAILLRARSRNRSAEKVWIDDPVVARALTGSLRALLDHAERRVACVHADPITDKHGFCATHAYVRKSTPVPDAKIFMEWLVFRREVASKFSDIRHCSGKEVAQTSLMGIGPA